MASHLLLLVVLICASPTTLASVHRHHQRHPPATPLPSPRAYVSTPPPPPQIHQACRATRSPEQCESALSHLPSDASALEATSAALSAASQGVQTARSNAQAILDASASNVNRSNAARNCLEFLSYADRRLEAAASALRSGVLADARIFAGAAELYQYDCWSALKYVNGTQQVADAMSFLAALANLTGGTTAMVTALQRYGEDTSLWTPPQTERDGYWPDDSGLARAGDTPRLVGVPVAVTAADSTVCSGGCKFDSIQAAVDAAPANCPRRFMIYIKAGVYREIVRVPIEKTNLVFLGDGMGKTVITGNLSADTPGVSTYNTATVGVSGDGFMACNLTFANTAGPDAHQAVAFRSDSDHSILESVEFLGHQDTLYAHALRQLYKNCRISGTVDFIFGNSATVFLDCLIFVVPRQLKPERGESNTVTAHGRTDPAQPTGFVFVRCTVNGSDDYLALYRSKPAVHRVYLGRPWKEYSRTVFLNCYLAEIVRPEGWLPWSGDFALPTLYYGEFGSSGPGANATARVPWSSQIPEQHLGVYSLENFIQGDQWIPSDLRGRVIS